MKVILQRVLSACVSVNNQPIGRCANGFCILAGISPADTAVDLAWMAKKIATLRVFADEQGKMNRSILDINGSILLISQFTLLADCQTGRRPSFTKAGDPHRAAELFDVFAHLLKQQNIPVETGIFGAEMLVQIENDGPATFILESPVHDTNKTIT